jgi:hypothetical protein
LFRRPGGAGSRNVPDAAAVRVVPHAICLPGAAGFAACQQLNRGTPDRAVHAGQVSAGEVTAWWAAVQEAAETGTFSR